MDETLRAQLNGIQEVDLLIGLPSYNSAPTIAHVVEEVAAGLARYFPNVKSVLVNSDGGSTDGTQQELKRVQGEDFRMILTSHPVDPIHKIAPPYHRISGRENAFRTIFNLTHLLKAKVCAVVNPNVGSISPEWVQSLLQPVFEGGFDCVVPIYARDKFDGTLTNGIVYPLTRALYGKKILQPIGGDFGLSRNLTEFYLAQNVWETEVVRLGIDIWMTTLAISESYRVCQSFLGPKIYPSENSEGDLGSMFAQIVSPVFGLMEQYQNRWQTIKETTSVPTFGHPHETKKEPLSVNRKGMMRIFRLGIGNLMEIWGKVLATETALLLRDVGRLTDEAFSFPQGLWVQIVYDFALAYHKKLIHRDHLLKSMIPLYLGHVASFVKENEESSEKDAEEKVESLCAIFEDRKPYLVEHWNESTEGGERYE